MPLYFIRSPLQRVAVRGPLILLALTWTILLSLTVAMMSFISEIVFVSAVSPSSWFSRSCGGGDVGTPTLVRLPILDVPGETVCLPTHMLRRSKLDFFVPTLFAALVVAASACFVSSLPLWDSTARDQY